jgi:hypothetical protein
MSRTDKHRNPTAFTTAVAKEAGLQEGVDYERGDSFTANNVTYFTAHLLGDPILTTIRVINTIGFYTSAGQPRWPQPEKTIALPRTLWTRLPFTLQRLVISEMYHNEGGTEMIGLFPPL